LLIFQVACASDCEAAERIRFGRGPAALRDKSAPMVTHRFKLEDIAAAYDLFSHQRDGVLKIALTP
jgi:threonine dehydrogenase-like Zn-dependent dehydrogenase